MTRSDYVWDRRKDAANRRKHGVSFAEAVGVFTDELALTVADEAHSQQEERERTVGRVPNGAILTVAHTARSGARSASSAPAGRRRQRDETTMATERAAQTQDEGIDLSDIPETDFRKGVRGKYHPRRLELEREVRRLREENAALREEVARLKTSA